MIPSFMKNTLTQFSRLTLLALLAMSTPAVAGSVRYILTDAQGTPVVVTDEAQNVIETSQYSPYGDLLNRSDADEPGYTGHEQDAATGLVYMQQRYFDPAIGVFVSTDPLAVGNDGARFSRYSYGASNPYIYHDPDGQQEEKIVEYDEIYTDFYEKFDPIDNKSETEPVDTRNIDLPGIDTNSLLPKVNIGQEDGGGPNNGEFSILDWDGYPDSVSKPNGPFRIIEGKEYALARRDANRENSAIRRRAGLRGEGVEIHEIKPVKFGGSPTAPENKQILSRDVHRQEVTPWWNRLLKDLTGE